MKNILSITAFAASAFALFALSDSASAATYTITDTPNGPIAAAVLPGPPIVNSPVVIWPATGTGCIAGNCFRDPFEGTGFAGSQYLSVGANGSATYTGFGNANLLNIGVWGSVDLYNGITFTGGNIGSLTIMGSDAQLYGAGPAPGLGHDVVSILFDPGLFFTSVTFFNNPGIDAFEMANLSACVGLELCKNLDNGLPIPAALPLFASGLAGFGGLLGWRRKKKAQASAIAA